VATIDRVDSTLNLVVSFSRVTVPLSSAAESKELTSTIMHFKWSSELSAFVPWLFAKLSRGPHHRFEATER